MLIDALLAAAVDLTGWAIVDRDAALCGCDVLGVPVAGDDDRLPDLISQGISRFLVGLGSSGDASGRARLFEVGVSLGMAPVTVVHPSAVCSPGAKLGDGCQLLAGAIVNTGAVLGRNVIVNTGAIIEHDCALGDHAHVATGARLASTVRVGNLAHVGAGATVRQLVSIGTRAVVGAGAAVVKDVAADTVVVGVPARLLRR